MVIKVLLKNSKKSYLNDVLKKIFEVFIEYLLYPKIKPTVKAGSRDADASKNHLELDIKAYYPLPSVIA